MAFKFTKTEIPEVILVELEIFHDERGFFAEIYKFSNFRQSGINKQFVQFNQSRSKKGVLRGLHYQLNPTAQGKLVNVVIGEIFDVAVDIRHGSPWYGKWVSIQLSAQDKKMLYIPEGFAHGFCVLSDIAEVMYYCTKSYAPDYERGIIWNDPALAIEWPVKNPVLSRKDSENLSLEKADNNFEFDDR